MKFRPLRARIPSALLLGALLLAVLPEAPARAQLRDPANLGGERVSAPDLADTLPIDHGAPALQQLLQKLRTRASFMLIVAHPDDEDGGLLTYLSRGQGARVAMLTLNRGEGGQNLMSADFDDALGLIRTQELLAADRTMGVDQFFGTEVDFGFSKTKEEAFAKWTRERVLYDAVRAVRLYRPLVIASVFIGAPSDGHGQHQVAGEIAQEVFSAAGDPNVFPDQIAAGLEPWQPLKVYARTPFARIDEHGMFDSATNQYTPARFTNYVTGRVTSTIPRANVIIPEGEPATYTAPDGRKIPIPGMDGLSYIQFAREGLALEKSQIGPNARLASPGPHDVSYHRYGSRIPGPDGKPQPDGDADPILEPSLFTGIDTSFAGMATLVPGAPPKIRTNLEAIDQKIAEAQRLFDPPKPELIAPQLRWALGSVVDFIHELEDPNVNDLGPLESYNLLHELRIKRVQLNNALVLAQGLTVEAVLGHTSKDGSESGELLLTSDKHVSLTIKLTNQSSRTISTRADKLQVYPGSCSAQTINVDAAGELDSGSRSSNVDFDCEQGFVATRPYFSRAGIEQPYYDISTPALRNAPSTPSPLTVVIRFDDQGVPLEIAAAVRAPNAMQPVAVVPPDSVSFSRTAGVIPIDDKQPMAWVESRIPISKCTSRPYDEPGVCGQFAEESKVQLNLPPGWQAGDPTEALAAHGMTLTQYEGFTLAPPALHPGESLIATAAANFHGHLYSEGYRSVGYPGIATTNYFRPAVYRATALDLHLPEHLFVGYIQGTGDEIYGSLFALLGGNIQSVGALTPENLKRFDAIILGVRAYESHPELVAANAALSAYAADGGVVIVQYVGRDLPAGAAPYPLSLGDNEKVVEEDAAVELLAPTNPLLTWPNPITSADFDHWVEERGHGFMSTWDPHYQALLATHDHGQAPQRGGLLIARTGRGAWIYLGLALYRQLPEGVPGAYRLLANLISAGKNPAFLATPPTP